MRRLISLALTLTLSALGLLADTQSEFNAHLKAYNSRIAAHQYLPMTQSAAASCGSLRQCT